ncbi:FecCD family ABC transporter permease [Saccharomonospora viridis]|jgi:iron complex transport system permease protein|uniref:ABC-type Fe3+-siderophore transport system, permease component n=2 Tax=Saccharomonospora viridis TaxID=1852 RepID=C7MTQ6_SACVD|nr:iron chelate uptake ABC transporter family permease subunit [Saccharomonospora viridis]ACU96789.1 ABC-type Fe3+-siderophore transport system, permease component [Saccharomonospora viridis DSM 43017]KHF42963.1 iron ABC transporter permease [Saccharomonospora viridis]SFO87400.1 iron complex transport system permease protein [Saccharomonospora viridis]
MTTTLDDGPTPSWLRSGWVPHLVLGLALAVAMVLALGVGSVPVDPATVVGVIARRLGAELDVSVFDDRIVWQLRLPRVLGAAATGAGLALCGAVLQSLTRNDLAEPYLLGISGGAAVGAVSVLVLGISVGSLGGAALVGIGAFTGALGALILVLGLAAGRSGALPPTRVVLAGVAIGQICSAYTSLLVVVGGDHDAARRVLNWTLGSLAGVRWTGALTLVVLMVAAFVLVVAYAPALDAFAFGETAAGSLGVRVQATRWTLMTATALVTAGLVSFTGAIGFVGLVVPHLVRLVCGPLHGRLLPLSALAGAVLLVLADLLARSLVEGQEIPIGVITAVVGAPVFAFLLRREGRSA